MTIQEELDSGSKVDIYASSREHTQYMLEAQASEETYDILDVAVWQRIGFEYERRVDFLLTCGGPTVMVRVDEGDCVTFEHSWGINPHTFNDETSIRMHSDDAQAWIDLANTYREVY